MTAAVIIGSRDDEHVQAVLAAIGPEQPLVIDAAEFESSSFSLRDGSILEVGDDADRRSISLTGSPGWVRRLSPPRWRPATVAGSRASAERAAFIALVVGVASTPGMDWLTPYPTLLVAENKLRQAAHAQRLGIDVPRTVVASDPRGIPDWLGDEIVVKPLGPGHYVEPDGQARVIWVQSLARDDPRLAALAGAPFLLQERISARRHLRIVTCGSRAWSCELVADGLPLDWRRSDAAHHSFCAVSEPRLEDSALTLAADLELGYSSQDWLDTGTRQVFIDLNPAGQWLFLPETVSAAVTHTIAEHLSAT